MLSTPRGARGARAASARFDEFASARSCKARPFSLECRRAGKMSDDLEKLFESQKLLAITPAWTDVGGDVLEIVCPLQIAGTVVQGLQFRLIARKSMADEMVTDQIEYHQHAEGGGPLARIEWKPLSGHNNRGRGPKAWQHRVIQGCHHHSFALNQKYAAKEIGRGPLPIALPLEQSPPKFDELLNLVGKEFRITNIEWVEIPPWEPALRLELP